MTKFNPSPKTLYSIDDLFKGFDPKRPATFGKTLDFQIYLEFVSDGGAASRNKKSVLKRAEHDCTITGLVADEFAGKKVVAIMGGHNVTRNKPAYRQAALAAALLTQRGFLVISGGGPGAMEAVHLGAAIGKPGPKLDNALKTIQSGVLDCSGFPVTLTGDPKNPVKIDADGIENLGRYYAPAFILRQALGGGGGVAIPTWMYGWEPTTVFAGKVGKYFQNSIREDGLLAAATHGIIYVEGRAGTLQEIFQDAGQNYYKSFPAPAEAGKGEFSPMVFLGRFWRWSLQVEPVLQQLWGLGGTSDSDVDKVLFTGSVEKAVEHIAKYPGVSVPPALAGIQRGA